MEDTGHQMLDRYRSFCIKHIDYQASMAYKGLTGVFDTDKTVEIYSVSNAHDVVGYMNLRTVFYSMRMMDGRPLFAEVHQAEAMMNVDVVVGMTAEAVTRVDMINKNVAAYLFYNFPIHKVQVDLIERLLRVFVDPKLIKNVGKCPWDNKSMVLTTPKDVEEAGKKKLEDTAWY